MELLNEEMHQKNLNMDKTKYEYDKRASLNYLDKINEIENKLDELAVESCTENTSLEDLIYEIQVQVGALKDFINEKVYICTRNT